MDIESASYMELALHLEGQESIYLRIPTFWDPIKNQWIGAIRTPKTMRIISSSGKDSFELQNNFSKVLHKSLTEDEKDLIKEVFDMFKPLKEWE